MNKPAQYIFALATATLFVAAACSNDYQLTDSEAVDGGALDADLTPVREAAAPITEAAAPDASDIDAADASTNGDAGPPTAPLAGEGCALHPGVSACVDFEGVVSGEFEVSDAGASISAPGSNSLHALYITVPTTDAAGGLAFKVGAVSHIVFSLDLLLDSQILSGSVFGSLFTSTSASTTSSLSFIWQDNAFHLAEVSAANGVLSSETVLDLGFPQKSGWVSVLADIDLTAKTLRLSVRVSAEDEFEATGQLLSSGVGSQTELDVGGLNDSTPGTRVVIDNFVGTWQ